MSIVVGQPFAHRGRFGDGSDGNVTLAVNTTLTRDMFYLNLTVNAGVMLDPDGFRIFVQQTLDNNGTISRDGTDSTSATGGAALSSNVLRGGEKGGNGTLLNGTAGDASAVYPASASIGQGGAGGNGTGGTFGGAGGTVTYSGARLEAPTMAALFVTGNVLPVQGLTAGSGAGGGGGGTGNGGGGGGGGGNLLVVAQRLDNDGTISATGGDGASGQGPNSGGGGGGGGGVVALMYHLFSGSAADVSGGAPGPSTGGGAAPGIVGNDGVVYQVVI